MKKLHSAKKKNNSNLWPIKVFFITFVIGAMISAFSQTTLLSVPLIVAFFILVLIIAIGIFFDIIGVAVAYEDVTAYAAMASKKIKGSKEAIKLVQNSHMVSNICNDVIGDICGIVSGSMGAVICISIAGGESIVLSIAISSVIAALTVSGKATGKIWAKQHSRAIVFAAGKFIALFDNRGKNKSNNVRNK